MFLQLFGYSLPPSILFFFASLDDRVTHFIFGSGSTVPVADHACVLQFNLKRASHQPSSESLEVTADDPRSQMYFRNSRSSAGLDDAAQDRLEKLAPSLAFSSYRNLS